MNISLKITIFFAVFFLIKVTVAQAQETPQLTNDQWKIAVQSYRAQLSQAENIIGDLNAQLAVEHEQVIDLQTSSQKCLKQTPAAPPQLPPTVGKSNSSP